MKFNETIKQLDAALNKVDEPRPCSNARLAMQELKFFLLRWDAQNRFESLWQLYDFLKCTTVYGHLEAYKFALKGDVLLGHFGGRSLTVPYPPIPISPIVGPPPPNHPGAQYFYNDPALKKVRRELARANTRGRRGARQIALLHACNVARLDSAVLRWTSTTPSIPPSPSSIVRWIDERGNRHVSIKGTPQHWILDGPDKLPKTYSR